MFGYKVELDTSGPTVIVRFPDFPEAGTEGPTEAEAMAYAVGALEEAIAGRMTDREEIPPPYAVKGQGVDISFQTGFKAALYSEMLRQKTRKADLARALGCNQKQVDRLLDLNNASRIEMIEAAFRALGKRIDFRLRPV